MAPFFNWPVVDERDVEYKGKSYRAYAQWAPPPPPGTMPTDRNGRYLYWVEEGACVITLENGGQSYAARLSLFGPLAASLAATGHFDEKAVLDFYFERLPSLMELDPSATPSYAGILNTPPGKWFCHLFEDDGDRINQLATAKRSAKP